jgi:SNF2-related domain/Helicase conserved C-terminal domain/SWIM zinc finger
MTPQTAFSLKPASLNNLFSDATYARGLEVYRLQKVVSCTLFGKSTFEWDIEGRVDGSHRETYDVDVSLGVAENGDVLHFKGQCSCPVGYNCKHAIALTLKAVYQFQKKNGAATSPAVHSTYPLSKLAELQAMIAKLQGQHEEQATLQQMNAAPSAAHRQVNQWLDLFGSEDFAQAQAEALTTTKAVANSMQRVYVICEGTFNGVKLLKLRIANSRLLSTGKYAKLKEPSYSDDYKISSNDKELQLLVQGQAAPSYSYRGANYTCTLTGATGKLILELAFATDRLFLADDNSLSKPAVLGGPRQVSWRWLETADMRNLEPLWHLSAQLDDQSGTIYANTPPMYLDAASGLCGWVEMPQLAPERLALLLKAPPIPQSAFSAPETTLLRNLVGLPLPPVIKAPQVLEGLVPKPHLHISLVPSQERSWHGLLCATLRFEYGDLRVFRFDDQTPLLLDLPSLSGAPSPGMTQPIERIILHRDMAFERATRASLRTLGLQTDHVGQCHLNPALTPAGQWLSWADNDYQAFKDAGFEVTTDANLDGLISRADDLVVQLAEQHDQDKNAWFDLSLGMDINGQRHNILPMLPELLAQLSPPPRSATSLGADEPDLTIPPYIYLAQADGNYLRLPTEPLKPWLQALLDLFGERGGDFNKGDTLRLTRLEALRVGASLGEGVQWQGANQLRELVQQLGGRAELPTVTAPEGLLAELRPYQLHGLTWLQFLRTNQLAGILADDMGLGKTLQTLAHILLEKQAGRLDRPALIIAPVSLMGNWRREAERFTPSLRTLVMHGKDRHESADDMAQHDIIIAPYSLLQRDSERWLAQPWHIVVLDEAQNIKNANTHAAKVAGELNTRHRLCLSGTPMENHLGELWSLFHFLMPGFLSSQTRFKALFRTPIEKHGDNERLDQLRRRITPFMLRRHKAEVATDLPAKLTQISSVELTGKQANLYETIRLTTEKAVREALASKGLAKSQIQILDALLKLRQVCCDPRLVPIPAAKKIKQSAKLELLMEILPEMIAEGRKILLFSQFTSMLTLIEEELVKRDINWVKLTGQSQNRDALIERFTSDKVPLFLISLKAGGVGLNLTQADTVIHYDPWWNPAVETQATDRAHRIGQTQRVMVYKLVVQGTIEQRILALQERKAALAQSMYSGSAARKQPLFTESDLAELLLPLGT